MLGTLPERRVRDIVCREAQQEPCRPHRTHRPTRSDCAGSGWFMQPRMASACLSLRDSRSWRVVGQAVATDWRGQLALHASDMTLRTKAARIAAIRAANEPSQPLGRGVAEPAFACQQCPWQRRGREGLTTARRSSVKAGSVSSGVVACAVTRDPASASVTW